MRPRTYAHSVTCVDCGDRPPAKDGRTAYDRHRQLLAWAARHSRVQRHRTYVHLTRQYIPSRAE